MLPPRTVIAGFCLRFALILGVYLLPWPPVGDAYAGTAVALANAVVNADDANLRLEFARSEDRASGGMEAAFALEVLATDVARNQTVRLAVDLRALAYVPTAVFIALAIAAPIWERRRGFYVLSSGLVLLHTFFAASVALSVVLFLAQPVPLHAIQLSRGTSLFLGVLHRVFVAPPGMAIAVPGFVWLALLWLLPETPKPAARGDGVVASA